MHLTMRLSCALLLLLAAAHVATAQAPWPTGGWTLSTPEAQGLASAPLDSLDLAIRRGTYGNVDHFLVVRRGYLVYDRHYDNDYAEITRGFTGPLGCGHDACTGTQADDPYNYYHPSTHPYYRGRAVHSLQSVTKSVSATLLGIALERGEIPDLSVPLLDYFRDYDTRGVDERLRRATLEDLLTMRTGIEWHEQDRPLDSTNTTIRLERSDDWIQFTLNQPSDAAPGEKWTYNSGGSHLMSGVIRSATGMTIDQYAEAHLFGPLGIGDYHWKKTPRGLPDTEGGLYLEPDALARIGYLYLRGGLWEQEQLLGAGFVQAATTAQADSVNGLGWGYGYQWWRVDEEGFEIWAGLGFGGQYLLVFPREDLVAVVNGWNVFNRRVASIYRGLVDALKASARR